MSCPFSRMARADRVYGGDAVQERGLAAAGSPHDGDELPLRHIEADPVQGFGDIVPASVILLDCLYLQHVFFR